MSVCYSSLLNSVGIRTAFVDVIPPGKPDSAHIYMMLDTGIDAAQAQLVSDNPKRYVVRTGSQGGARAWLPVETTVVRSGFDAGKDIELGVPVRPGDTVDVRSTLHEVYEKTGRTGSMYFVVIRFTMTNQRGEMVAIVGASGAGKSTLLQVLGALERPTGGDVFLEGTAVSRVADAELAALRNRSVGFVFQFHHLLKEFTALENVMMPQMIRGLKRSETVKRATEILAYLGLGDRIKHRPSELSGGEQQRVAIARAVANAPRVLFADEPTGNLDPNTADHVFHALMQLVKATRVAMLIVTHNMELAGRMDRRVTLENGRIRSAEAFGRGPDHGRGRTHPARRALPQGGRGRGGGCPGEGPTPERR